VIILSLDLSTKTGYAVVEYDSSGVKDIIDKGALEQIPCPPGYSYPLNYVMWANICYGYISEILNKYQGRGIYLAIEETAKGARDNMAQKILEFIHFKVAEYIDPFIDIGSFVKERPFKDHRYFMTEEWRRITGCQQNAEEKRHNAKRSRRKKKQGKSLVRDEDGKIMGRVTKKHVNVRRANEVFGLELILKQEDIADALLINYAYYLELRDGKK